MFISKAKFLLLAFLVVGCTRPPDTTFTDRPIVYDIKSQDRPLPTKGHDALKPVINIGTANTKDIFEYIKILHELSLVEKNNAWSIRAQRLQKEFYNGNDNSTFIQFGHSPYTDFLIAKSKPSFMRATGDLDAFFAKQKNGVDQALAAASARLSHTPTAISLSAAIQLINDFMTQFEWSLQHSDVDASVKAGVLGGLYQKFWLKLPATTEIVDKLETAQSFEEAVQTLRQLIGQFEVSLTMEQEEKLRSANEIGQMLNKEMDPADAFTLLIEIWDRMSKEERKETFGEMSPELYTFLSTQKIQQRDCLKRDDCANILLHFTKKFLILPNIKKYGVDRLKQQLQASAIEALKSETGSMASDLVKEMPSILKTEIFRELDAELARYSGYRNNFEDFIRSETQRWFEKQFYQSQLPALESAKVLILKQNEKDVVLVRSGGPDEAVNSGADVLGAALALPVQIDNSSNARVEQQIIALTRVNQILAHGGFYLHDGSSFPSLSRAVLPKFRSQSLNIEKTLHLPSLFVIPTPTQLSNGFEFTTRAVPSDLSVLGQAQLLKGFTNMITAFRDWEKTEMDALLGKTKARDILASLPGGDLDTAAFPKDAFLALAVGNASAVLANLKAKGSPLFVMCAMGRISWQEDEFECERPAALAGMVNVKNYRRENSVNTIDHAEFLESLIQFLKVAAELQKTKSEYLIKSQGKEPSGLAQLQDALPQLRSFALSMTNFLTHHLQSEEGEFYIGYDLKLKKPITTSADFRTQLVALRALTSAADYFRLQPYRMSALSNYFYLNRELWDESSAFYKTTPKGKAQKVTAPDIAMTLYVLRRLRDYPMSPASQQQLEILLSNWTKVLSSDLNLI